MSDIAKGDTFADGQTVTGARLNNVVDLALAQPGLISGKTAVVPQIGDAILIHQQSDLTLKKAFVSDVRAGIVAQVDLNTQGAAIGSTTLYAVPAAQTGLYVVSLYAKITGAATTSSSFTPD